MNRWLPRLSAALAAWAITAAPAGAESTSQVLDIPVRGVTQRVLYLRPPAPAAILVFLPGRNGVLGVADDGSLPSLAGRCGPVPRNRQALLARGFVVVLVDRASDGSVRRTEDVGTVIEYARARDALPVWIVGGSGSTTAALRLASELPSSLPVGVIVFSPWWKDLPPASAVRRPVLVIDHARDAVSAPFVEPLMSALAAAPAKERVTLDGGGGGEECGGAHLFYGIDAAFVEAVSAFALRERRW